MKGVLTASIDIFTCCLLNYWGFLILETGRTNDFAEAFWVFNSLLLLGYFVVSYSIPALVLSVFHFGFLIGCVCYYSNIPLLVFILVQMALLGSYVLFVKQKESAHKLKPIFFVVMLVWLVVARSLV